MKWSEEDGRDDEQNNHVTFFTPKSSVEQRHIVIISCLLPCRSSSSSTLRACLLERLPVQLPCVPIHAIFHCLTCVVDRFSAPLADSGALHCPPDALPRRSRPHYTPPRAVRLHHVGRQSRIARCAGCLAPPLVRELV
jgi:hypothetical protein